MSIKSYSPSQVAYVYTDPVMWFRVNFPNGEFGLRICREFARWQIERKYCHTDDMSVLNSIVDNCLLASRTAPIDEPHFECNMHVSFDVHYHPFGMFLNPVEVHCFDGNGQKFRHFTFHYDIESERWLTSELISSGTEWKSR